MDNMIKNEILNAIKKVNQKVDEIQKEVAKIPEIQKEVAKISEIQEEVRKMQEEILEIQENARQISRSVAVIEQEHGDKLKALFDAFTINTEKIEEQQEKIQFCEKKLNNHDIEIDYLKNKVQGL